jgi:hypothetical protein
MDRFLVKNQRMSVKDELFDKFGVADNSAYMKPYGKYVPDGEYTLSTGLVVVKDRTIWIDDTGQAGGGTAKGAEGE